MYQFECSGTPSHTSYSASKDPNDSTCPICGEPSYLVSDESQDKPTPKVES